MSAAQDTSIIREALDTARRKVTLLGAVQGMTAGIVLVAVGVAATWNSPSGVVNELVVGALLIAAGAVAGALVANRKHAIVAHLLERRAPQCQNLVVTAHELLADTGAPRFQTSHANASVAAIVYRQAATVLRTLDVAALFPLRSALLTAAGGLAFVLLLVSMRAMPSVQRTVGTAVAGSRAIAVTRVDVQVTPPAYVKRATPEQRDPVRVEALAGSTITLHITAVAKRLAIETLTGVRTLTAQDDGTFTATVAADSDGFIAIDPIADDGRKGARRLIGLSVLPDLAPHVRISAPAKDMMLPDANRALDIGVEADDDIALAGVRLRYTQVSGAGERYTFKEGEVPLQITRSAATGWTAKAHWNLASLGLEAGDMVVYRAVASDARPGAIPSESDSYIAEVLLPGTDAAAGFSIDPEQERYALSQQMIIVKTERLLAKRGTLSAEAFLNEANDIAVEQRRVRAEFVFMMGGELSDEPLPDDDPTTLHEEAEAEGESDILAGRSANAGRIALVSAIRNMSSAVTLLNTASVTEALAPERAALKALERAFSHTRILLRALSTAEKLDLTRRMTGPLLETGRDTRASANPEATPRVTALRGVLADMTALAANSGLDSASTRSARAVSLAERVLRVAPADKALQAIATSLTTAANAYASGTPSDARAAMTAAAVSLTAAVRAELVKAPASTRTLDASQLDGALNDAVKRARGAR